MSDLFNSFMETLHKRATTSIVGTYALFWSLLHWQFFYTSLFVSEEMIFEKFGLMKNEYINRYFMNPRWDDAYFYISYLLPALLTYLYIWQLPKLLFIKSFKKERDYKVEKRIVILENEIALENKRTELTSKKADALVAEKKVAKTEQEIIKLDPTVGYEKEYEEFIKKPRANETINEIKETVYGHYGFLGNYQNPSSGDYERNAVDPSIIAIAHTNNLIELTNQNTQVNLTEKGMYFLSKLN